MKESGRAVNTNGPCKQWFQTLYPTTVAMSFVFFFLLCQLQALQKVTGSFTEHK